MGQVQSADLFCLAHTVFWKKKVSSKLSTFKTRESSPKENPDFHFLITITKANISVWLTACGPLSRLPGLPGTVLCCRRLSHCWLPPAAGVAEAVTQAAPGAVCACLAAVGPGWR